MGLRLSWAAANGGRAVPVHVELAKKRNYYYYYIVVEGRGGKANLSRVFSPIAAKGKDMRGEGGKEKEAGGQKMPLSFLLRVLPTWKRPEERKKKWKRGKRNFAQGRTSPFPFISSPFPFFSVVFHSMINPSSSLLWPQPRRRMLSTVSDFSIDPPLLFPLLLLNPPGLTGTHSPSPLQVLCQHPRGQKRDCPLLSLSSLFTHASRLLLACLCCGGRANRNTTLFASPPTSINIHRRVWWRRRRLRRSVGPCGMIVPNYSPFPTSPTPHFYIHFFPSSSSMLLP